MSTCRASLVVASPLVAMLGGSRGLGAQMPTPVPSFPSPTPAPGLTNVGAAYHVDEWRRELDG
jgi:hypothetical protein